jgi:lysophospholipase L1-like esterase
MRTHGIGKPPLPVAPTVTLSFAPASPKAGDMVIVTAAVTGNPLPTALDSIAVTLDGVSQALNSTGSVGLTAFQRRFFARATGSISATATVSNSEGTASDTKGAVITAPLQVASVSGFGSSSMEGDAATTTAKQAINLAQVMHGAATLRNKGIAGTVLQNSPDAGGSARASNGRDRFAADLLGANQSERLIILYGANDLRYTGAPATFNLANFITDLREILNGLLTGGYSRDQIVLCSPNWYPDTTYDIGSAGFTGSNRTIHEQYVQACADIAAEYGVAYGDLYAKMRDLGQLLLMSADGLHCNDLGHEVIAHAFMTAAATNALAIPIVGGGSMSAPSELSLDWAAASGATGYTVQIGGAGTYRFDAGALSTASLAAVFAGLPDGTYLARIRAEFGSASGPWTFWPAGIAITSGVGRTVTGADDFTGDPGTTLLTALTADVGTWVKHPLSTGDAATINGGGALRGPSSTSKFHVAIIDDEPLGADGVYVELDYVIRSNSAQLTAYAVARCDASSLTFIAAGYNGSLWRILKYVAGAATVLGSYSLVETIGATPVIRLEVENGAQRLYRDDVLLVSTAEPDAGMGSLGEGLGLRIGAGTTSWTSTTGPQVTAIRVGPL